jgi:glycosyltransferase involved in cell wall biosynthesis
VKIAVVSAFYSEGMGYSENCLPKALAKLGHDVHLVTSDLNVFANSADYEKTYASFLGSARQSIGSKSIDGYTAHRLKSTLISGYVRIKGLSSKIREISPDIVHCTEIASLQTFSLAASKPMSRFRLFTENHQHLSIVKPFLKQPGGNLFQWATYRLTRTLPTYLASLAVEKCYVIAPDCAYVAQKFYGVPKSKIRLQSLGTDTDLFRPATTAADLTQRNACRWALGYNDTDIVCVYTGRFTKDKNPLLLAKAIDFLSVKDARFHGLFIGEGAQREAIEATRNSKVEPFMTHNKLAEFYRAADVAVWPTQESMSMLDAAASGLPLIVSRNIGEYDRVDGNGRVFEENSVEDLIGVLGSFASKAVRLQYGLAGTAKMANKYSWLSVARAYEFDYLAARQS